MRERDRRPGGGDIQGPTRGDFSYQDNRDEELEDAPESYYDDGDSDSEDLEFVPDDPDYDLSEAAGYADYEPRRGQFPPQWLLAAISILLVVAIILSLTLRFAT
ncbi:MAG TPA: hypothetical protein VNL15_02415 [Dehalococcoidia bacterium]|nr:hypothetical protein [Dehalococcoidia bacterium]